MEGIVNDQRSHRTGYTEITKSMKIDASDVLEKIKEKNNNYTDKKHKVLIKNCKGGNVTEFIFRNSQYLKLFNGKSKQQIENYLTKKYRLK